MSDQTKKPNDPSSSGGEQRRSVKIDPYEARERERERYRRGGSRRASAASAELWNSEDFNFRENFLVFGLLVTIVLLVGSGMARFPEATRYWMLQLGTFLILLLLGTCRTFQEPILPALRRDTNLWLLGLAVMSGVAFVLSPYRTFAAPELLRVVSGIGVYFVTAYTLRSPRQVSYVLSGMLGMGVLLSLYDLSKGSKPGGYLNDLFSLLGTHEHAGSVLTLLLPVALVFALHPGIEEKRRLAATAAALILGVALLSARSRSGWIATLLAVVVLAALHFRYFRSRESESAHDRRPVWQRALLSPVVQVLLAMVVFFALTNLAPLVSRRASVLNLMDDAAFTGRLAIWQGTGLMIGQKPLLGWGLGSFPIFQGEFTHIGDDPLMVLKNGTSHDNNAHSYYLQWTAETGLIGLFLHVGVLASFILTALAALPRIKSPFQVALLSGVLAAVLASLVDSLSSPMYHFAGIWAIQYAWIGLGIAALRTADSRTPGAPGVTLPPPPVFYRLGSVLCAFLVAGGVGIWAFGIVAQGARAPQGRLWIVAEPIGPVSPGTTISWRAVFQDGKEVLQPTLPGTSWSIKADPPLGTADQELREIFETEPVQAPANFYLKVAPIRQSLFSVLIPSEVTNAEVTVKATYRDRYGRMYDAWSTKAIRRP